MLWKTLFWNQWHFLQIKIKLWGDHHDTSLNIYKKWTGHYLSNLAVEWNHLEGTKEDGGALPQKFRSPCAKWCPGFFDLISFLSVISFSLSPLLLSPCFSPSLNSLHLIPILHYLGPPVVYWKWVVIMGIPILFFYLKEKPFKISSIKNIFYCF